MQLAGTGNGTEPAEPEPADQRTETNRAERNARADRTSANDLDQLDGSSRSCKPETVDGNLRVAQAGRSSPVAGCPVADYLVANGRPSQSVRVPITSTSASTVPTGFTTATVPAFDLGSPRFSLGLPWNSPSVYPGFALGCEHPYLLLYLLLLYLLFYDALDSSLSLVINCYYYRNAPRGLLL